MERETNSEETSYTLISELERDIRQCLLQTSKTQQHLEKNLKTLNLLYIENSIKLDAAYKTNKELLELRTKYEELKAAYQQTQQAQHELKKLNDTLKREYGKLRTSHQQAQQSRKDLRKFNNAIKSESNNLRRSLQRAQESQQDLIKLNNTLETEYEKLKISHNRTQQSQDLKEFNDILKSEYKKLKISHQRAQQSRKDLNKFNNQLKRENKKLKSSLLVSSITNSVASTSTHSVSNVDSKKTQTKKLKQAIKEENKANIDSNSTLDLRSRIIQRK